MSSKENPYIKCSEMESPIGGGGYQFSLEIAPDVPERFDGRSSGPYAFCFYEVKDEKKLLILESSFNLYFANTASECVGEADSYSEEDGEMAFQLFNVKREPYGYLMTLHRLCEDATVPEGYEGHPMMTEYLRAHRVEAHLIINRLFVMLGEYLKELARKVKPNKNRYRPVYVAFLADSPEYSPAENELISVFRKSAPDIRVKKVGASALSCEDTTMIYRRQD